MPKTHPRRYRIESLVQEALAPMVVSALPEGIVTIRQVMLNNDFSVATVTYTTVGDNAGSASSSEGGNAQQVLEAQAWKYRRQLALSLNMRKTPRLVFVHDDEGLAADKMRVFLEKITDDDQ